MVLITCISAMFIASKATAFVLLAGTEVGRLPANIDSPIVNFSLDPNPPKLKDKGGFLGGIYQNYPDEELWPIIVREAMERWNTVDSSFLQLEYTIASGEINTDDGVHTITIGNANITASASALPIIEDRTIVDCDIKIADRSTATKSLAYTIMHEIGHCLGLGHNHLNYNAVMGYSRTSRSLYLGSDDKAGISYLYPIKNIQEKELISCGTIKNIEAPTQLSLMVILLLPLLYVIISKTGIIKD